MKQQKKQYRPIAGQTWYEKVLDWITREENYRWSAIWIGVYGVFLLFAVYISANLMNRPDIADLVLGVWFRIFPVVVVVAAINPLSGIWGLRAEGKLHKSIKDYLAAHNYCTYGALLFTARSGIIRVAADRGGYPLRGDRLGGFRRCRAYFYALIFLPRTIDELVACCIPIKFIWELTRQLKICSNAMNLYGRMAATVCLWMKIGRNGGNNGLRNAAQRSFLKI